jgi:peptide/nickel transport system substrate-binding protein
MYKRFYLALCTAAGITAGMAAGPAAAQEDTLVIARNMEINSLDPGRAWCDTCQIFLNAMYQTLVSLAADNRTTTPNLATSWDINGDQTEFTFHLDPKAVFADGSPVEAKDVKFTFERLQHMKSGPSFMMDGVTAIEAKDAHTVTITLASPNSEFLGILNAPYTGISNSDVVIEQGAKSDEGADASDSAESWFLDHSAGSGPYVLVSYRPDDELRLQRNDSYWGEAPAMREIVIKHTKDAVTQAQMLETGAADIAMQIDPDTAKTISSPDVTVKTVPSFNFVYVALSPGSTLNKVPLTPDVRRAFAYAIDYQGAIDFTLGGEGDLQPAPIPNGYPGTSGLPAPEYNPDKARELLAAAGLADGFELETMFPNLNVYGVDLSTMMQKIQQDVGKVGITLKLQPVTMAVWRENVNSTGIPLTAVYYAPDYYGSGQYVQYFAMSGDTAWSKRAGAANDPSIVNKKEGELLKLALAAGSEQAEELFHQIGMEMINDRIIIPITSPKLVLAYRNDVKGVRYSACCNLPLAEISR